MKFHPRKYFQELKDTKVGHVLKYIGPGFLITVGFIDPGNWAANVAAGSQFGFTLLWVVTLSTLMLILLQYNASKLGIITGDCLAEAVKKHFPKPVSKGVLGSAMLLAIVSTALAELLGGAIALKMLFNIPLKIGAIMMAIFVIIMIFSRSYKYIEAWIIGFVSLIGISFLFELTLVNVSWPAVLVDTFVPTIPVGSIAIIMSVLGAVVMPHNLFLHSEIIQTRSWDVDKPELLKKQLRYAKTDTVLSMVVGWAINSAMIILAAATFYQMGTVVTDLSQAKDMLLLLLGSTAAGVFAVALLFAGMSSSVTAGMSSSVTAGMSGGVISSGYKGERYNTHDKHASIGVLFAIIGALVIIFFIQDPFYGLIISQILLAVQLPITVISQIIITSSKKVMGEHANSFKVKILLFSTATIVIVLNVVLFVQMIGSILWP